MGYDPTAKLAYGYDMDDRDDWDWDAVDALGLKKVYFGGEPFALIIAAHVVKVEWGCIPVDLTKLADADQMAAWDERLAHGLDALDITPPQEKPSWLLAAHYG